MSATNFVFKYEIKVLFCSN